MSHWTKYMLFGWKRRIFLLLNCKQPAVSHQNNTSHYKKKKVEHIYYCIHTSKFSSKYTGFSSPKYKLPPHVSVFIILRYPFMLLVCPSDLIWVFFPFVVFLIAILPFYVATIYNLSFKCPNCPSPLHQFVQECKYSSTCSMRSFGYIPGVSSADVSFPLRQAWPKGNLSTGIYTTRLHALSTLHIYSQP